MLIFLSVLKEAGTTEVDLQMGYCVFPSFGETNRDNWID